MIEETEKLKTVYVIMQTGWTYDDQYYSRAEDGAGHAKMFYYDETEAKKACHALNVSERSQQATSTYDYGYYYAEDGAPDINDLEFYYVQVLLIGEKIK